MPHIDTKSFDETWSDFVRRWKTANVPLGVDVEGWAFARAKAKLPLAAEEYETPEVKLLAGVCWHMSGLNGNGRFYLSSRKAGGLLGVSQDRALSWLRMFCADGILEITEPGNERRATRYRYLRNENETAQKQKFGLAMSLSGDTMLHGINERDHGTILDDRCSEIDWGEPSTIAALAEAEAGGADGEGHRMEIVPV